jgi:protein gp37
MRQAHRFNTPSKLSPYHGLTVLRPKTAKRPGVDWSGRLRFVRDALGVPLKWRKPRRIFVNSMSDLFHEALDNEDIAAVFGVMAACPQHTFQVLTKRPARAVKWFAWAAAPAPQDGGPGVPTACGIHAANAGADVDYLGLRERWPLPNVWIGVSAENQETADERIPLLLKLPAAVRFVSAEPLLGALDLRPYLHRSRDNVCPRCLFSTNGPEEICPNDGALLGHDIALDWVIVGGESGNGARPFDTYWARLIVEQCRAAKASVFVKQLGAKPVAPVSDAEASNYGERLPLNLKDRKGGDMSEWPESLRLRQFPEVRP